MRDPAITGSGTSEGRNRQNTDDDFDKEIEARSKEIEELLKFKYF